MDPSDKRARLDQRIKAISETGSVRAALDGTQHDIFPVAIDLAEGMALQRWVRAEQPSSVIEIGLGYGFATLNALSALLSLGDETARYFAIDPNQAARFSNIGVDSLYEFFDADRIEVSQQPSEFILPKLTEQGRTFDFAIVDGNHRFDGVFLDLFFLEKLIAPGKMIFLDDYQLPGIRKVVDFFVKNLEWTLEEVSESSKYHQWAVVRTRSERLDRAYDFFVDF